MFLISGCLLSAGCNRISDETAKMPPAAAFIHFEDQVAMQMLSLGIPWRFPCARTTEVHGEKVTDFLPLDQCVKFTGPQRLKGLWRDDFEGSVFCPAPAKHCGYRGWNRDTWLDPERATKKPPDGSLYAVDFIGRRSVYPGEGLYGHMGGSHEEVIVDRFISMKLIGPSLKE